VVTTYLRDKIDAYTAWQALEFSGRYTIDAVESPARSLGLDRSRTVLEGVEISSSDRLAQGLDAAANSCGAAAPTTDVSAIPTHGHRRIAHLRRCGGSSTTWVPTTRRWPCATPKREGSPTVRPWHRDFRRPRCRRQSDVPDSCRRSA
jgi:hypothetical protein